MEKIVSGRIKIPYAWPAGRAGSRFLIALRDEKQILGLRCPACAKVRVPPGRCLPCDRLGTEWVAVGPEGTLESWTVIRTAAPPIRPRRVPYAVGIIRLDGADSGLVHLLGEVDPDEIRAGVRLRPVFEESRRGHILDIRYFRPV